MSNVIDILGDIVIFSAILFYAVIMFDMVHEITNATTSIAECYVNNVCEYKVLGG